MFTIATQKDPKNFIGYNYLSKISEKEGDFIEALKNLNKAIKLAPFDFRMINEKAGLFERLELYDLSL